MNRELIVSSITSLLQCIFIIFSLYNVSVICNASEKFMNLITEKNDKEISMISNGKNNRVGLKKRMIRSKGGAEMVPALYYEKIFAANRNMHQSGGENKAVADSLRKSIKQQEEFNQLLKELLNRGIK